MKKEWYMISIITGKEKKIIESLKNKIEAENMKDLFEEIKVFWIPTISSKESIKKAQGKDYKTKEENLYKGYIFIKMTMTDEAWFLVRNTEFITGLVGSSGGGSKPTPVSARQFEKMLKKQQEKISEFNSLEYKNPYQEGVVVKIKEGSFKNEKGVIIETNFENLIAVVEIITFGRKVPVEFPYNNLEIINEE